MEREDEAARVMSVLASHSKLCVVLCPRATIQAAMIATSEGSCLEHFAVRDSNLLTVPDHVRQEDIVTRTCAHILLLNLLPCHLYVQGEVAIAHRCLHDLHSKHPESYQNSSTHTSLWASLSA